MSFFVLKSQCLIIIILIAKINSILYLKPSIIQDEELYINLNRPTKFKFKVQLNYHSIMGNSKIPDKFSTRYHYYFKKHTHFLTLKRWQLFK